MTEDELRWHTVAHHHHSLEWTRNIDAEHLTATHAGQHATEREMLTPYDHTHSGKETVPRSTEERAELREAWLAEQAAAEEEASDAQG